MGRFTFIKLLIRIGPVLAVAVGLSVPALAWWATAQFGLPLYVIAIGAILGLLAGFFVMVLVDLTRVLAEMLLPQ